MSYKRILTASNRKMKLTMKEHPELEIRVVSLPCIITCPFAGKCRFGCYATSGQQGMPDCVRAYMENLDMVRRGEFFPQLRAELTMYEIQAKRKGVIPYVRVHDSGDFVDEEYLDNWLKLMREFPDIHFYAYTKCVRWMDERRSGPDFPDNFRVIYSFGGTQDYRIIERYDSHAHVIGKDDPLPEGYVDASHTEYPALSGVQKIALRYHGKKGGEFKTI